jgi:hypothetical protein
MSELINKKTTQADNRWRLFTTVSVLALLTASYSGNAKAEDIDRPTIWIELGGQLERVSSAQDPFTAPFLESLQTPPPRPFGPLKGFAGAATRRTIDMPDVPFDISQPLHAQAVPENNFGEEGKLVFSPAGLDWVFSVAARYGRANGSRLEMQQTNARVPYVHLPLAGGTPTLPRVVRFSNAQTGYTQSHAVLDFQVGRDVGLGLFGRNTTSLLNAGVRFAQFTSKSSVDLKERPQFQAYYNHVNIFYPKYFYNTRFQDYEVLGHSQRSFHGIGPSVSWSGSTPVIGNKDSAEFTFDWGVNAAVLFGRQRAKADRKDEMTDSYWTYNGLGIAGNGIAGRYIHTSPTRHYTRSRAVTVPNIGGFAGMSLKFPNAKISLGYRADFFFGAMDAGIAERHTADMSFHGPFATISIGLGG